MAFGVAPPIGMLPMGSGEGCHLLGLGDGLSTGVGEMVAVSCSSMGEVLCGEMSGGNGGVWPSRMWYEAARALLSSGGTAVQDDLASGEKVAMAPALLSHGLFL